MLSRRTILAALPMALLCTTQVVADDVDPDALAKQETEQFLTTKREELLPWMFVWGDELARRGVAPHEIDSDIIVTELGLFFKARADEIGAAGLLYADVLRKPDYKKSFHHMMTDMADFVAPRYKQAHWGDFI